MIDVNFAREKKKPREKISSDTYRCVDGVKISKKKSESATELCKSGQCDGSSRGLVMRGFQHEKLRTDNYHTHHPM